MKFKDVLNSYKMLYHFTTLNSLLDIAHDNSLKTINSDHVSTTRNANLKWEDRSIRIALDPKRLKKKYELLPYIYDKDSSNEQEIGVYNKDRSLFPSIEPLEDFVIRTDVIIKDFEKSDINKIRQIAEHYPWLNIKEVSSL
jgi:hypothetical protein